MRARRLLPGVLILAGCMVGSRTTTFRPALSPRGISVNLNRRLTGELLAVTDSALWIWARRGVGGVVVLARYRAITLADVAQIYHAYDFSGRGVVPDPAHRERLRLVARYPQGLTPDVLAQLLRAAGQSAPEDLR